MIFEVILPGWQNLKMQAQSFPKVFISKLKDLQELMKNIKMRVYEKEERPKALDALKQHLNSTTVFLETVRNMTDIEDPIFTEVELTTLEKLINETKVSSLLVGCLDEKTAKDAPRALQVACAVHRRLSTLSQSTLSTRVSEGEN